MKNSAVLQSKTGFFILPENLGRNEHFYPSKLGTARQCKIFNALSANNTDKVYLRGVKLYRLLLNGLEEEL